jgi:transposase
VLHTVRCQRLLCEQIAFNLLFRWFIGLGMDCAVWDRSTFSQNCDRLFNRDVARLSFGRIKGLSVWDAITSDEHFSVGGMPIGAWASHKSFVRKDGSQPPQAGTRNPTANLKGSARQQDPRIGHRPRGPTGL